MLYVAATPITARAARDMARGRKALGCFRIALKEFGSRFMSPPCVGEVLVQGRTDYVCQWAQATAVSLAENTRRIEVAFVGRGLRFARMSHSCRDEAAS